MAFSFNWRFVHLKRFSQYFFVDVISKKIWNFNKLLTIKYSLKIPSLQISNFEVFQVPNLLLIFGHLVFILLEIYL